jgi:uncharacterized membrane protein YeaQ/YmgE (transglycosylase-associated protein family)
VRKKMEIVYWVIIGSLAGFLAKMQFPAKKVENIFGLLIIGSVGGVLGGWSVSAMGHPGLTSTTIVSYVVAFVVAALLLFFQRTFIGQRAA